MRIDVIVPAWNRPGHLRECLAALRAATHPDFTLTVVDDASTEVVASVAREHGARYLRMEEHSGVGPVRNRGARGAEGDILLFVDSDIVVPPDLLTRVERVFAEQPDVAAIIGSYDARPRARTLGSQFRNLLHHYVHQTGDPEASTFFGALGAMRRAVFEEVGGFASGYYGEKMEDIDIGYRLRDAGHRIRLEKSIQGMHLKRWTLASMIETDFDRRAVPWARLLLERPSAARVLNVKGDQRASVALVGLALALALAALWRPGLLGLAALALAGVVVLNLPFYRFLARERGAAFAVASFPLHLVYFLCAGAGYLWAWLDHQLRRRAPARG